MKIEKCLSEKMKLGNFPRSVKIFRNRGTSETGGEMDHCFRGDGTSASRSKWEV